jgi:hypothetical protein
MGLFSDAFEFVTDLFDFDDVLDIGGTALNIYGQKREADRIEGAAEENAARLQKEAEYQQHRTDTKLKDLKNYKDQFIGKQRVAFAASGIRVDANTALEVVKDTARNYQMDKNAILVEGGFNVERALLGAQAQLEAGSQAKSASRINIGKTFFSSLLN